MTPMSKLLTACVISLTIGGEFAANAATLPQLPQRQVDVTMPTVTGSTLNATCTTLQAQINAAAALSVNLTHQIILATGTVCTGPYVLRSHAGPGWIIITGPNGGVVSSGTRVTTASAASMPQVKYGENSSHNGSFSAESGATHYRIIGIDMIQDSVCSGCAVGTTNYASVYTGYGNGGYTGTGYIIVDRSLIRDMDNAHYKIRGMSGDADLGNIAMIDSYCAGVKEPNNDTQCFLAITNPGPILVRNNYLEATGENLMLGGGVPAGNDPAKIPQDVTITLNTFQKNPLFNGNTYHQIKSLLETKLGKRVKVDGNDFVGQDWNGGGQIWRLTVRNENGTFPQAEVSDITFTNNKITNSCAGISSFGSDDGGGGGQSMHAKRWNISNNLFVLGANCTPYGSNRFMSIAIGGGSVSGTGVDCTDSSPTCKVEDLTIRHNTVDMGTTGGGMFCIMSARQLRMDWKDNLINAGSGPGNFDCNGGMTGVRGQAILDLAWGASGYSWLNNGIANISVGGEGSGIYPQGNGNIYPASATSFLWTNPVAGDYTLQAGSPAKNAASDGTDMGVNFTAYNAARAGGSIAAGGGVGGADLTPPATPQNVNISIN